MTVSRISRRLQLEFNLPSLVPSADLQTIQRRIADAKNLAKLREFFPNFAERLYGDI